MTQQIAVIGAGNWGKNIVRTLHSMDALHSVTEQSDSLRSVVKEQYPNIEILESVDELLQQSSCPVILATPVATHFALAKKLLEAGRDLLIEKPMAMNQQECIELNAIAKKNKCILMVGHLLIYQPAVTFIKEYMTGKKLGKIHHIYQVRRNLGTIRTHENALYSLGVHDLAVLDYLVGQAPSNIQVEGQSIVNEGIEDDVQVHMTFVSGLQTHLHNSWLWPIKERYLMVSGEKGMLKFDEGDQSVTLYSYQVDDQFKINREEPEVIFQNSAQPLEAELTHFIACCTSRATPNSDGAQGERVVSLMQKAMQKLKQQEKAYV